MIVEEKAEIFPLFGVTVDEITLDEVERIAI